MALIDRVNDILDRTSDTIDTVTKGDLSLVTQSAAMQKLLFWGRLLLWLALVIAFIAVVNHFFFKYNKRILVKRLKGNSVIDSYFDRGRIFKDERGKLKLKLLKTKGTCPIPSFSYTSKMGKQDFYELYLDEYNDLYPVNDSGIVSDVKEYHSKAKDINFHMIGAWRLEEMKTAEEKYKKTNPLIKYLPEFILIFSMVLAVAVVWISVKSIESGYIANANAILKLAESVASLK